LNTKGELLFITWYFPELVQRIKEYLDVVTCEIPVLLQIKN